MFQKIIVWLFSVKAIKPRQKSKTMTTIETTFGTLTKGACYPFNYSSEISEENEHLAKDEVWRNFKICLRPLGGGRFERCDWAE